MIHLYLAAVGFGVTLLIASVVLGKDTHHGGDTHGSDGDAPGLGWAPITSLRFWVFLFAFGGGAGLALTELGSSELVSAIGAGAIGWTSGALAVAIITAVARRSVTSGVSGGDLVGATGLLTLPVGKDKPGKVRLEIGGGRAEDFVANVIEGGGELATGTTVLVISSGGGDSVVVAKHDV